MNFLMKMMWLWITGMMIRRVISAAQPGSCPTVCFCPLDPSGRRQVICNTGGLVDPLPVLEMPSDAEILIITSPPDRPNTLTLGPIFKGHHRLEQITVTRSGIPALGIHSFWGLRRLHTLNVSHNSISAIIETNFRGADKLHTLDLSHNHVESVPSAVFRYVRSLHYLNLAHNRIPDVVPRMMFGLSLLKVLDLSHNPLGHLPADRFTDVPNLRELSCSSCGLQAISAELLQAVPHLQVLDLRDNRLMDVPPITLSLQLKSLLLDGNHIAAISSNALSAPSLETLTITQNRLASIKSRAMQNSSISHLDVRYNRLTKLRPESLSDALGKLRNLRLSGNPLRIEQLVQMIPRARQLRHLEMGELGLASLPGELLRQSRHLKTLNVSGNYLSDFPASSLFATPHLSILDLSHNNFRGLEQDLVTAFKTMASLDKVWLQNNPWQCQRCHIAPMLDWLRDPTSSHHPHADAICRDMPDSPRCLKCTGPPDLAGHALQLLEKANVPDCGISQPVWPAWLGGAQSDDPRSPRDHHAAESIEELPSLEVFFGDHMALIIGVGCGLVLALLLVVVAALVLARRHSALYYTNETEDKASSEKLMSRNNNDNSPQGPRGGTPRSFPRAPTPYTTRHGPAIATIDEVDSIAGSSVDLQVGKELNAPKIVRLMASPLP
ncbi:chondroadherin-like protein [Macrobrachium nipponense]|uniref:chondroadherin-like protein n=1 Tax=Macrobrachium nipponense TaxID=159736 RepID=UPI0030C83EE4